MPGHVWNSTLKRKTPLQRVRIRAVSEKQQSRNRDYRKTLQAWWASLGEDPKCWACVKRGSLFPKRATQNHHRRGKVGSLLCDTRFFTAVDFDCHGWIHDHPAEARALELLAEAKDWNVPLKDF